MLKNGLYCDHCGKQFETSMGYDDLTIEMGHKWTTADLCIECLDKLYDIVTEFCERQRKGE